MRLSQQMKLAPRMIQSMEILQMPLMALQERIDQELESNVALELVEPGTETEIDAAKADQQEAAREELLEERPLVVGEAAESDADDWQRLSVLESSYDQAFDNEYSADSYKGVRNDGERDRKLDAMANVAARRDSLADQLLAQWRFEELDPDLLVAGEKIIQYIDDDGLLAADLTTILDQNRNVPGVNLSLELLQQALTEMQQRLDPPGIGASDRRESILIQIDRRHELPGDDEGSDEAWADLRRIIADHYDDLLQNRLPRIAQKANLTLDRIATAVALLRRINIKPGRDLVETEVPPIIPDVIVDYDDQADAYIAALTDGLLPAIRISRRYEKMAKDRSVEKSTRDFVGNNVRNAAWLIESINQRRNTLLRVVNVVLARQREFFDHGPQHLKPLPMIEVADQLGIHVATVSRAVSDKWMQTPRGLVPLRRFFSGGTETDTGRDMSWEAVKATLKEIIDAEDRANPLSDEALAAELKKRGIDIARRTVVKYRQQLDIPPARRRKTY